MGVDAALPPGLWERVRRVAQEEMAKFAKSGFLRNASITGGGLTIRGGFLRLAAVLGGVDTFYVGPVEPNLPDGSEQPGFVLRRNDGTVAFVLRDPIPAEGDYNQFLAWLDRSGSVVVSDDTDSGQGLARPFIPGTFHRQRINDWPSTVSATFEGIHKADMFKQHPRLSVVAQAYADGGTTGEIRVTVNGTPLGSAQPIGANSVAVLVFGPLAVTGAHMSIMTVQIEARRVSGTGVVRVEPLHMYGRQSA